MYCDDPSGKTRSCPTMAELIHGVWFGRLTSAAFHHPTPTVWASISAARVAAVIFAGICCAMFSAPVKAGFQFSATLSSDQNIASPMNLLSALGYAGLQHEDCDFVGLSNESANCETQNVTEKPAELFALPMEQPVPFRTPLTNGWDVGLSGSSLIGSSDSPASGGGISSAGLLSQHCRQPISLLRYQSQQHEFLFLPDAPPFGLFQPS